MRRHEPPVGARIRFAEYEVDPRAFELVKVKQGRRIPLQRKPMRLLLELLRRPGEVVTRAELSGALWDEGVFVDHDAGLNTAVKKLREVLEDSPEATRFIETVPRVGYRFVAPVRELEGAAESRGPRRRRTVLIAIATVAVALFLARWFSSSSAPAPSTSMPSDPSASGAYLEGIYYKAQQTPEALARAVRSFERATKLEPNHASSWAHLGEARAIQWFLSPDTGGEPRQAREAVDRALRLDPQDPTGLRAKGILALHFDWDFSAAASVLQRAAELDPSSPETQLALATWFSVTESHDEAIHHVRRAIELDPVSFVVKSDAGYFLLRANREPEAVLECERALRLAPEFIPARWCLVEAHRRLGNSAEYRRHARLLLLARGASLEDVAAFDRAPDPRRALALWDLGQLDRTSSTSPVRRAALYAILGESALAIEWLETAYDERNPLLVFMTSNPSLRTLRDDPRFEELLRRIGLSKRLS